MNDMKICPYCGKEIPTLAIICKFCETSLVKEPKKFNMKILYSILAAFLILSTVSALFLFHQYQLKEQRKAEYKKDLEVTFTVFNEEIQKCAKLFTEYKEMNVNAKFIKANPITTLTNFQDRMKEQGRIKELLEGQGKIDQLMVKLKSPPGEYKEVYQAFNDLYVQYSNLQLIACYPNIENFDNEQEKFIELLSQCVTLVSVAANKMPSEIKPK